MVSNIVFQLTGNASGIVAASNTASDAIKKTNSEVSKLDSALSKVGAAAAAYFSVQSVIAFGKEIVAVEVKLTSLRNRFEGLTGSAEGSIKEFARLQALSDKLGLSFTEVADSFMDFAQSAKSMNIPLSQSRAMFNDLTKAIAGAHLSTQQQGQAMLALTQMMSKGKIQAQELTLQLGQALPGSIGIMARSLGITTAELNKMMEKGELLSSVVLPKFAKELEKTFGGQAELAAESLNGSINRATNAWIRMFDVISESAPTKSTINAWTDLLDVITKTIQLNQVGTSGVREIDAVASARIASEKAIAKVLEALDKTKLTDGEKGLKLNQAANESLGRQIQLAKELKDADPTGKMPTSHDEYYKVEAIKLKIAKEKEYQAVLLDASKAISDKDVTAQAERKRIAEESAQLTDKQKKALEDFAKALRKLQNQAQIELHGGAESVQGIRLKAQQDIELLKETKEYLALPENEQSALVEAIQRVAQKQVDSIVKTRLDAKIILQKSAADALKEGWDKGRTVDTSKMRPAMDATGKTIDEMDAEAQRLKQIELDKNNYRNQIAQDGLQTIINLEQSAANKKQHILDRQLAKGLISEATYQKELTKIKRKEAIAQKATAIASIAINTAVAVSTNLGAPTFGALTPLIIGLGAAQAAVVASQPIAYAKGTKYVPQQNGAIRGKDSVHAILMPGERVVPTAINETPGYRSLLDTIQDKKISPRTAQYLNDVATGKSTRSAPVSFEIDYDEMGKAVARYAPKVSVTASQGVDISVTETNRRSRL